MPGRLPLSSVALAAVVVSAAPVVDAQYPDVYVAPAGALRIGFEPTYLQWDERFDADGTFEPFGSDFSDSLAGAWLLPTLAPAESALRTLLGDAGLTLSAGRFTTTRVGDVRSTPFTFALGLTGRITLTASLPIVTTRAQVDIALDSTESNVGWNQAAAASGNPNGALQVQTLLGQLATAAAFLEAQIAAECPGGAQCAEAAALLDRTRVAETWLGTMAGVGAAGAEPLQPPFAPLAGSPAGLQLSALVQTLSADLQLLGAPGLATAFPLPTQPVGAEDVSTVLTDPAFGYDAYPLEFAKYRNRLGDAEVGLRFGLLQGARLRSVLFTTVRLPTGTRDLPEHFVDIGTGDRQTDVIVGAEAAWAPGLAALAFRGSYTVQLADDLDRRLAPHDHPVAPAFAQATVSRDLGDVLRLALYPSVRLTDAFMAYGSAHYMRRAEDTYAFAAGASQPAGWGFGPDALAFETAMETWSFGGGVHYRATRARHDVRLPIEAGVDYVSVFHGSGGQTPKTTRLSVYLRLYTRVFGRPPAPEATEEPEATEPPGDGGR